MVELKVMTIDLTTRKLVMKPVWTPLVGKPVNFHVSRAHVMDIFLGKIIMYFIRSHGSLWSHWIPWGPKGFRRIGREACELPRVLGPCDGHFPR